MFSLEPNSAIRSTGDSWPKSLGKAAVGVLVVLEIGFVVLLAARPAHEIDRPTRLNIRGEEPNLERHSNPATGVAFKYPAAWMVEDDGRVSRVTSPSEKAVISVGPGPSGDALAAMDEAQALMEQSYSDLEVTKRGVETIETRLAITLIGHAVNAIGARVNFSAAALEFGPKTMVATEFDATAGPPAVSNELRRLLESLKPPNGSI